MNGTKGFEETIDWYNKNANAFANRQIGLHTPEEIEKFSQLVGKGKKVLDAGCGSGRDGAEIDKKGLSVVGVDISEGLLLEARKMFPNLEFVQGDIRKLPFKVNSFDGVWAQASLLHFERVEDVEKSLSEFNRVLKQKGILYLSVKQQTDHKMGIEKNLEGWERFFQYFTQEEVEGLIRNAGFEILSLTTRQSSSRKWLNWIIVFARKL